MNTAEFGGLLLSIGYFVPLPPNKETVQKDDDKDA